MMVLRVELKTQRMFLPFIPMLAEVLLPPFSRSKFLILEDFFTETEIGVVHAVIKFDSRRLEIGHTVDALYSGVPHALAGGSDNAESIEGEVPLRGKCWVARHPLVMGMCHGSVAWVTSREALFLQ